MRQEDKRPSALLRTEKCRKRGQRGAGKREDELTLSKSRKRKQWKDSPAKEKEKR